MGAIARQLSLEATWDDDGDPVCVLPIVVDGDSYAFIVGQTGDAVRLWAVSNIKFPPGGLPEDVISFLVRENRKLEHCDFDFVDNRRHSYFCIKSVVRWSRLTAGVVQTAIRELVSRISALDKVMIRQGYAY